MTNLKNMEIIGISTTEKGKLKAILSYQNPEINDLNNGYDNIEIPVNIRELQLSVRGNILVDQSVKEESISVEINPL